ETTKLDFISLSIALVFGTAGLPHVLMRFYTVPTAKEARRSVTWAIALIGAFYLFTLVLGFGAAAMVGPDVIEAAPGGVNSAAPLLAFALGGEIFLGIISAVAFATILGWSPAWPSRRRPPSRTTSTTGSSSTARPPRPPSCASPGSPSW